MKQNQLESLRLNVCIKTVWLAVRFNCKLSFVLKNDLSEVLTHTENSYPLNRGQAIVNDYLSCPVPPQLYTPSRKIKIFVYLVSANGIVPAGFAVIPSQSKQKVTPLSFMLPLERCEDPKAQIKLILSVDTSIKVSTFMNHEPIQNKRFNSPISNFQMHRDISRASYSAAKIQHSKLRHKPSSNLFKNSRELKIVSHEKILQKQPELDLSRQQLIKEHQQYWVEIVRMQAQNEGLKEEIFNLKNQSQTLKSNAQNLKIENQGLRLENEKVYALLSEVNECHQTILRLQTEAYDYKQRFQMSNNECYSLTEQLKRIQSQHKESLELTRKLNSRIQAQIAQYETSKQMIQNLKVEKSRAIQQIEELNKELENAKISNGLLIDMNQNLKNQAQKFELEIKSLKISIQYLQDFKDKFQQSKEKISQLENEINSKNNIIDQLTFKINVFQMQINEFKGEITTLSSNLDFKQKQLQRETILNNKFTTDLQEIRKHFQKIENQFKQNISNLEKSNLNLANKLKVAEQISETLRCEKTQLKQKNAGLEQELEQIGLLIKKQQQQKQSLNNSITQIERQLESAKSAKELAYNSITALEENLRQSQATINKLGQDLNAVNQQNRKSKSRVNELQGELECSHLQMTQLRQIEAAKSEYYENYNKSITQMTLENIKIEKEKDDLGRKLEEIKHHAEQKQKELSKTKQFAKKNLQEILKLRRQKEELENKMRDLTKK